MTNSALPGGWQINDIAEIDNYNNNSTVVNDTSWATVQYNGSSWNVIRQGSAKVDNRQFVNAVIYDNTTNQVLQTLQVFDPYQGIIPGIAKSEIAYMTKYDPANYNTVSDSSVPLNAATAWGLAQVGKLWWDLGTTYYLDYQSDTTSYKWKHWGQLAPNVTIDVYEWTRSPVPPASYNSYSNQTITVGLFPGFTCAFTGTVANPSACGWVQNTEWSNELNSTVTAYYFWVLLPTTLPGLADRSLSAQQVANILQNPLDQDIPYFAAIDSHTLLIGGVTQYVNDTSTVLKLNWNLNNNEGNFHKQWVIFREGDIIDSVDPILWNKLSDSLVGWNTNTFTIDTQGQNITTTSNIVAGTTQVTVTDGSGLALSGEVRIGNYWFPYGYKVGNTLYSFNNYGSIAVSSGAAVYQKKATNDFQVVPDPTLSTREQLGNLNNPIQSWFPTDNNLASRYARQVFVNTMNTIFQQAPYIDNWFDWKSVFVAIDPVPLAASYDLQASTFEIRNLLVANGTVTFGSTVFVPAQPETNNFLDTVGL